MLGAAQNTLSKAYPIFGTFCHSVRTEDLLAEQQLMIRSLEEAVGSIKAMVEQLTTAVSTLPPTAVGVAVPGAPSRFRLVEEVISWDGAEAACRWVGFHCFN
jgi:hypothetical protein